MWKFYFLFAIMGDLQRVWTIAFMHLADIFIQSDLQKRNKAISKGQKVWEPLS